MNERRFRKEKNGITLIALVITIIVLLILAGISISMLSGDNSILKQAGNAKINTETASEKELIQIEVLGSYNNNGKLEIATVNSNIKNNISGVTTDDATDFPLTVTYTNSGNSYSVYDNGKVEEAITYPLATETLKVDRYGSTDVEKSPYVNYTDSNGNTLLCRVLYNDENGIDIISSDVIKSNNGNVIKVPLGMYDSTVTKNDFVYKGTGVMYDSSLKCAASYNRALLTLNEIAESYRNKTNGIAESARCVGSLRGTTIDTADSNSMYEYTGTSWTYMNDYSWNGLFKDEDSNDTNDYSMMGNLEIRNTGNSYWLASRDVLATSDKTQFLLRFIDQSGARIYRGMIRVKSDGKTEDTSSSEGYGIRVVLHLKDDVKVISGEGTMNSPYILGK